VQTVVVVQTHMPAWHWCHRWSLGRGKPDNSVFDLTSTHFFVRLNDLRQTSII
jgi:hypothetical protein